MSAIGLFSDSDGDLEALDRALKLLTAKGARRFLFAGGRYEDLDGWVQWKREQVRASTDYSDQDFLEDLTNHLLGHEQVERPLAFGTAYEIARTAQELTRLKDRVLRTPEKGSLQYQDPSIPRKAVDMVGETLCCVAHDKNDFDKEDMLNSMLLVHGKESEPKVVQIGPRFFITPGKLKGDKASVGLLELQDKQLTFSAFGLDGAELAAPQVLAVAAKTKMSVK